MKRSRTRSRRPSPRRASTPTPRASARRLPPALVALTILGAGCVNPVTYRHVVEERDALRAQKEHLEESMASVEAERESLTDQLEDLRIQKEELERERTRLARRSAELQADLRTRTNGEPGRGGGAEAPTGTYEGLVKELETEVSSGQVEIERVGQGLRLNLSEDVLFPSGSADLSPDGRAVIAKVAEQVKDENDRVQVQGHTDSIPIAESLTSRFPSNWELGGARAAAVVRTLQESGVAGDRLTAVSYAEFAPVAPNDTPEGRAQNRRIEIRLLPIEPGAGAAP